MSHPKVHAIQLTRRDRSRSPVLFGSISVKANTSPLKHRIIVCTLQSPGPREVPLYSSSRNVLQHSEISLKPYQEGIAAA